MMPIRRRGLAAANKLETLASSLDGFPHQAQEAEVYRKSAVIMRELADAITHEPEHLVRDRRWNFEVIRGGRA